MYINNNMDIPFDLILYTASYLVKPRMKFLNWFPENRLNWILLSINPNATHLLEKYPDKISWNYLSLNLDKLLCDTSSRKNLNKINWIYLSRNPQAILLLEQNFDKIDLDFSSLNLDKSYAIPLLEKYPDKINWENLSKNSNLLQAIHILKANLNRINLELLLDNPSIFEIDTVQMNLELTKKANNIDF